MSLRNKMNNATIDRIKRNRKQKRKIHRACPMIVEILRWLLRNGINKVNIDGVKKRF